MMELEKKNSLQFAGHIQQTSMTSPESAALGETGISSAVSLAVWVRWIVVVVGILLKVLLLRLALRSGATAAAGTASVQGHQLRDPIVMWGERLHARGHLGSGRREGDER